MPFVAEQDGELVSPHVVDDDDEGIECPACGGEMSVRVEHERDGSFVARHFVHASQRDCEGESDEHKRMKAIAHSKLAREYPDATVETEQSVDGRTADITVEFDEPRDRLGRGIAVEVQHKNKSKDREATSNHYFSRGFSALWLYEYHYRGMDVRVDHVETVWPNAVTEPKGREAYPDAIRFEGLPEVEMYVPVPGGETRVGREGRRDLRWHWLLGRIDANRSGSSAPTSDGEWSEAVTRRVGIDVGGAKVGILDTPDGQQVLQFSKLGDQFADADTGVRLAPDEDVRRLVKFALDVDEMWDEAASRDGNGVWEEVCSVQLGEGRRRTKWVEFCVDPDGTPAVKLCKLAIDETDIPIRIDESDVEVLFEFVAELAARCSPQTYQRIGQRVVAATPSNSS